MQLKNQVEKLENFVQQIADCFNVKENWENKYDLQDILSKAMTAAKSSELYNDSLSLRKKLSRLLKIPIYSNKDKILDVVKDLVDNTSSIKQDSSFVKLYAELFKVRTKEGELTDHLKWLYLEYESIKTL